MERQEPRMVAASEQLPIALEDDELKERIPTNFALMLIGPPGVGKLEYSIDLMKYYLEGGEKIVFVAVDVHPETVRERARKFGLNLKELEGTRFIFIDCYSSIIGQDAMGYPTKSILYVNGLSNLEQIGMNILKAAEWLGKPVKVFFYSISPLFLHNSTQAMSRFFQIICSQVKTSYGFIAFVLQQGVHDEMTINTLKMFVDGVIEMRFNEKLRREMRIHHLKGISTSPRWMLFDIEDGNFVIDIDEKILERKFAQIESNWKREKFLRVEKV